MRKKLISLPAPVKELENMLHAVCDAGHWEGRVCLGRDAESGYFLDLETGEEERPHVE